MKQESQLHKGHRQRLRQRILDQGLDSLEPHEILEYLLGYAIPRQDTNPIAHALIDRFGSLDAVLSAGMPELCEVRGIGPSTARWLAALGELMHGLPLLRLPDKPACRRMLGLLRYACSLRRKVQPPCTMQLCLDAKGHVLFKRILTPSRAWGESSVLRLALEDMLGTQAVTSVILQFSDLPRAAAEEYDLRAARAYAAALEAAGFDLLDVVVLSETDILSFREQKLLPGGAAFSPSAALREAYKQSIPECPAMLVREIETESMEETYERTDPI